MNRFLGAVQTFRLKHRGCHQNDGKFVFRLMFKQALEDIASPGRFAEFDQNQRSSCTNPGIGRVFASQCFELLQGDPRLVAVHQSNGTIHFVRDRLAAKLQLLSTAARAGIIGGESHQAILHLRCVGVLQSAMLLSGRGHQASEQKPVVRRSPQFSNLAQI